MLFRAYLACAGAKPKIGTTGHNGCYDAQANLEAPARKASGAVRALDLAITDKTCERSDTASHSHGRVCFSLLFLAQVCNCSYFPHHRLYLTAGEIYSPKVTEAAAAAGSLRVPAAAPNAVLYSAEQLEHLLDPAHLLAACNSVTYALLHKVQTLCQILREALQQSQIVWQHVTSNWPAWHASLCEDAQYVMYYALGVVPAWIVCLQTAIQQAYASINSIPSIQRIATTASYASRSVSVSIQQIQKALAQAQHTFQSR